MTELNTLLRVPDDFDITSIKSGCEYSVELPRERTIPLHIALLFIHKDWNFYGYAVAHSVTAQDRKTIVTFEVLTLFTPDERSLYKNKFVEAGKKTGEVT